MVTQEVSSLFVAAIMIITLFSVLLVHSLLPSLSLSPSLLFLCGLPGRKVFGLCLSSNVHLRGKALPPAILHAMEHLKQKANLETKGLFRRAASKAKVDILKERVEENPGEEGWRRVTKKARFGAG